MVLAGCNQSARSSEKVWATLVSVYQYHVKWNSYSNELMWKCPKWQWKGKKNLHTVILEWNHNRANEHFCTNVCVIHVTFQFWLMFAHFGQFNQSQHFFSRLQFPLTFNPSNCHFSLFIVILGCDFLLLATKNVQN